MKCCQDEMPRQTCLKNFPETRRIPDFAESHYVRVLAQQELERIGKTHSCTWVEGCLADSGDLSLDRIFECDHPACLFRSRKLRQSGIQRRGFSASDGAGNQYQAWPSTDELAPSHDFSGIPAERGKVGELKGPDQPDCRAFSVEGREDRKPGFDALTIRSVPGALLGNAGQM